MVVVASMTNTINFHSGPHQDPFVLWKSGSRNSNNAKARGPVRNSHPPWNIGLQIGLCGFGMPAEFPNLEVLTQEPPIQPSSAQAGPSAGSRQNAETIQHLFMHLLSSTPGTMPNILKANQRSNQLNCSLRQRSPGFPASRSSTSI